MSIQSNNIIATDKSIIPIGTNLTNTSSRTKNPSLATLAYNTTDAGIYFGNGTVWLPLGNGSGVSGPGSSIDSTIATYNGTTGNVIKDDSGITAISGALGNVTSIDGIPIGDFVVGPGSSTVGDIAVYNNTTGNLIADSGVLASNVVQGPGTATSGDLPIFNGGTGKLISDSGVLASNVVQGPGSATNSHVAIFNGGTGKLIADSGVTISGTNTGDVTLAAFGASPNANGASLSGQQLTLQPASNTFPGGITTGAQELAGIKTFDNGIVVQTPVSAGVTNLLNKFAMINYASPPNAWNGPFTLAQNFAAETVGNVGVILPGDVYSATSAGGIMTYSQALPTEFRPGTVNRGGPLPIMVNGVSQMGYFQVSTSGVVTVGIGLASDGTTLVAFPAGVGTSGISDCAATYSLY